jgi:hypothetical protein
MLLADGEAIMSFCHLRLLRIKNDSVIAVYSVESPDFDSAHHWSKIGTLKILKSQETYSFENEGAFLDQKIIPPWVYGLNKDEQTGLMNGQFKDHGNGAWTMRIHHYASTFIKDNSYPERHPITFFKS